MRKVTSFGLYPATIERLRWLGKRYGSKTTAIAIAIDRLYENERGEMDKKRLVCAAEGANENGQSITFLVDAHSGDRVDDYSVIYNPNSDKSSTEADEILHQRAMAQGYEWSNEPLYLS
jgi:hypothetical protein